MSKETITVLGGTGKTGRRLSRLLLTEGHEVKVASRQAPTRFDWQDEGTWADAVSKISGVYIVPNEAPGGVEQLAAFTGRAVDAGVQRLVLLSAREWADTGYQEGLAREEIVETAGAGWTILRPVWFAQNFSEEPFLAQGIAEGELVFGTGEGRHPFIDAEDIAAVAAAALTKNGHDGQCYELTGPRAITTVEAVETIAAALGRPIRAHAASADEYLSYLAERYYSIEGAQGSVAMSEFIRSGQDERLSDGVEQALRRPPRDFADYARAAVAAGAWTTR